MLSHLRSFSVGAFLLVSTLAYGWVDSGHMVIAAIAYDRLTPAAKSQADQLLQVGGTERTRTFITAACWADDIRRDHRETGPWHYIDLHFRQDGKPDANKPDAENVVWAIHKFEAVLADKSAKPEDRADALRFILHFVGDIHQPLHATSRDTDQMPQGDAGGNKFTIQPPAAFASSSRPPKNLHALWDLGGGLFPSTNFNFRPLTKEGLDTIEQIAHKVESMVPQPKHISSDPMEWAEESLRQDKEFVYSLPEGSQPSPEYLQKAQKISAMRAALAGYRLSNLLNKTLR